MAEDFSSRWQQLDWDDISLRINSKTAQDVERALNAQKLTREDFMALISPAAAAAGAARETQPRPVA